ncbi:hypothetical protein LTR66_002748 [Elasticomyces elasticus]|nr:hypothetical protein LTR66_002748 [Elasticomyces elasticus]
MAIHLYCEYLLNIRAITITASLSTLSDQETKFTLSSDRTSLTLAHDDDIATIALPTVVAANAAASLAPPAAPSKQLSFRLQLQEIEPDSLQDRVSVGNDNLVPWSASTLRPGTSIHCARCETVLAEKHSITQWKDLPSEGWAEMMEFWHCHKPDIKHEHAHQDPHPIPRTPLQSKKGYGATSKLQALRGQGFIDTAHFLVHPDDCRNVEIVGTEAESYHSPGLACSACHTPIGFLDVNATGYRLYKWGIALSNGGPSSLVSFGMEEWIAAQILTGIEQQVVRKFVIRDSNHDNKTGLRLWVFTTDLIYSSSVQAAKGKYPTRAMKILWQYNERPDNFDALNSKTLAFEEIDMPNQVLVHLQDTLRDSALLLPESARNFQEWHVGLIARFKETETNQESLR